MKHLHFGAWAALALAVAWSVALPAQATVQQAAQAPAAPAAHGSWEINWGDQHCMLIRNSGGPGSKAFVLRRVPGSGPTDLITIDPSASNEPSQRRRELSILLTPSSGERIDGRVIRSGRLPSGNVAIEMNGGDDLLDQFASSTAIEVAGDGQSYFRMSYPAPAQALAALRECEDDALRGWGIDSALIAGVRTRPRRTGRELITSDDYPAEALRAHQEGTVLTRMIIDSEGRVEDCAIVTSSGIAVLDERSCTLAQSRGRFRPARGADGQPMRSVYVLRVSWHLPD